LCLEEFMGQFEESNEKKDIQQTMNQINADWKSHLQMLQDIYQQKKNDLRQFIEDRARELKEQNEHLLRTNQWESEQAKQEHIHAFDAAMERISDNATNSLYEMDALYTQNVCEVQEMYSRLLHDLL
jgi:Na+-translocating ferredoxin:NAD+ oxidoreductase RnfC subunit